MGKNIINITSPTGDFYIHLFLVNAIAVSTAFGRNNGLEMRVLVAFVTRKIDIGNLFYAVRQPVHNIQQSLKFNLFFGDRTIDFRSKSKKCVPQGFATYSHGLVKPSIEQMAHGNI